MADRTPTEGAPGDTSWLGRFARRLEQTKVTPWIIVAFFGALAVMSGLAAGVGYVTHVMFKR